MIEKALRNRIQPIADRHRWFQLWRRLAGNWLLAILVGLILIGVCALWEWWSPMVIAGFGVVLAVMTLLAIVKFRRTQLDYHAIARDIEQHHPDLQVMLLAAIEQEPHGPGGQYGYLQVRVIRDALEHANRYDWVQTVSSSKLFWTKAVHLASLAGAIIVFSQLMPSTSMISIPTGGGFFGGSGVTVTPGDATVEQGAAVVVLARFDGQLPPQVALVIEPTVGQQERIELSKNLDDPVFGGLISEVKTDLRYHIEYDGRRTKTYTIRTFSHPQLQSADAKIVFPAYTELSEKVIKDTRSVTVVEGSQLTWTFHLNKSVASAQLVPSEGEPLTLTADAEFGNTFTASFNPSEDERYELQLVDAEGLANKEPPRFVVQVHPNMPPDMQVTFPRRHLEPSPLEELSFEAKVSDDYGLSSYGFSYALAGAPVTDVVLGEAVAPHQTRQAQFLLALEDLQAQADQLLTYYFWADDVGPDGATRRNASDLFFAEIRPFDQVYREAPPQAEQDGQNQQQGQEGNAQQQGAELAELQKEIINATWNVKRRIDHAGAPEEAEDLEVVRQSQEAAQEQAQAAQLGVNDPEAAQTLGEATKHMATALDHLKEAVKSQSAEPLVPALAAEQSAYQELLKLRRRESQVSQGQSGGGGGGGGGNRSSQELQQLELTEEDKRYETERQAASPSDSAQRENLQILNRLRDLARHQDEMTRQLKELEAAMQEARTEEEKEEARRKLKRLREQQQQLLRDIDELQQRMDQPENRQRMAEAEQQLSETRSRVSQASEALEEGDVSEAITSTTRAQRELEELRDDFRRQTSSEFAEAMRQMRQQSQQLGRREQEIAEDMQELAESKQRSLTDGEKTRNLAQRVEEQKESVEEITGQMRRVTEDAEISEPLLSKKLYDTLRRTSSNDLDEALELTGELLRRNLLPQAREIEERVQKGIDQLRKGIEEAAKGILGDEASALRLARRELDDLIRQADDEVARSGGASANPNDAQDPNALARAGGTQQRPGQQPSDPLEQSGGASAGHEPSESEQSSASASGQQPGGEQASDSPGQEPSGSQPGSAPGSQLSTGQGQSPTEGTRTAATSPGDRFVQADGQPSIQELLEALGDGGGGFDTTGPLTGGDYRQWSDRLRDVEEMMSEPGLRSRVARVRDSARSMRAEFKRHGKEPQWDLVREKIVEPLVELCHQVGEQLARMESDEALVPIDRDPVPNRYAELVRLYYEGLGGGE